jgi:large subunit ribosomal protein L21
MYAIIETGGKQIRVAKGDVVDVELLEGQVGDSIEFPHVLLFSGNGAVKVGTPYLSDCRVTGSFLAEVKGPKVIAFKYKQRKPFRRTVGHRQKYVRIQITEVTG